MDEQDNELDEVDLGSFFYRNNAYTRLTGGEGEVALIDKRDPKEMVQMEPWLGTVFMLADGQHTVEELIHHMRSSCGGNPPADLERTILSVVTRLEESGTILLGKERKDLPYHLARPIEELDLEKAKEFLQEDGYYQILH